MQEEYLAPEKVCMVTGGASGIGLQIVRSFLAQDFAVGICDVDEENIEVVKNELSEFKLARFFKMDVANENDVSQTVKRLCSEFDGINVLVNNAGIANPSNTQLEKLSLEEWNRKLCVNLTGPFLCSKHCAPSLKVRRGNITNISSTRSLMSEPNTEAYAASKGGLDALTHAMAISLGPEIRVNSVLPGWIDTAGKDFEKPLTNVVHAQHPVGRLGCPEDICGIVNFLISAEANFITGQAFVVDGGMTKRMIYI